MTQRLQFLLAVAVLASCGVCASVSGETNPPHTSSLYALERPGSAPTVLFIHGFGQSTVYWQEWVGLLGDCGIHAVAVDLPGFGQSAHVAGPYTIEGLADAVAQFVQDRRLGGVTLVGNSMGSTVAQFVTLRYPRLVRRLLLTSAAANPPPRIALSPELAAERNSGPAGDSKAMVDGFFATNAPPPAKAAEFYEAGRQMNIDAAMEAGESNLNWTTLERLREIKVPVLIIQGRHDSSNSPEQGELMVSRMPHAQTVVLENSAHTPQWDEPVEFKRAALPFLLADRKASGSCKLGE